jgi:hypothetical protein
MFPLRAHRLSATTVVFQLGWCDSPSGLSSPDVLTADSVSQPFADCQWGDAIFPHFSHSIIAAFAALIPLDDDMRDKRDGQDQRQSRRPRQSRSSSETSFFLVTIATNTNLYLHL